MSFARQSKYTPSLGQAAFAAGASPKVLPIQSYTGFGVILSDPAATLTVKVGGSVSGPFPITITMLGTAEYRYPADNQMNAIFNAAFVEITWSAGTMRLFQKS